MADDADRASLDTEKLEAADIAVVRRRAAMMPKGAPGECKLCEEFSPRLVNGVCAPCRDLYKLP
jgi:hypothetical protein